MNKPLLVATGLTHEASILAAPGIIAVPGGGDPAALAAALEAAFQAYSPRAVASVGLGGALSPTLAVGDWVVGERVVGGGQSWQSDPGLVAQLRAGLAEVVGAVLTGAIAASEVMVVDAPAKVALHASTGALAVDMESHVAAAFAQAHSLPFVALRVISDGADRALPKAAQAGMKTDGRMDVLAVLRELAKDPRQFPALIRTGREAEVAFGRLKLLRRHDLLGRLGVGNPDLGQLALDVV